MFQPSVVGKSNLVICQRHCKIFKVTESPNSYKSHVSLNLINKLAMVIGNPTKSSKDTMKIQKIKIIIIVRMKYIFYQITESLTSYSSLITTYSLSIQTKN